VDAFNTRTKTIIEVESGRAIDNYQVLKDVLESCLIDNIDYLCVALRINYSGQRDFDIFDRIVNVIYQSNRIKIPLIGILIIGY